MLELVDSWNGLYERSLPENLAKIDQVPGVVLGFHATIDGLKAVPARQVARILAGDDALRQEVSKVRRQVPLEINSPRI